MDLPSSPGVVMDFEQGHEDSQLDSQEIVLCPFCCSTGTQGENPPDSVSIWCALPADDSSNNYSCVPLQTLAIYHAEASCVNLPFGPN